MIYSRTCMYIIEAKQAIQSSQIFPLKIALDLNPRHTTHVHVNVASISRLSPLSIRCSVTFDL